MSDPFIGEIRMFGGTFAPRGWAFCNGQILSIAQNAALFSLLGTSYGGDGRSTFALPDLQGRMPLHQGGGPGLTPRTLGESFGAATHSLSVEEMPGHTHGLNATLAGITGTPGPGVALAGGSKVYRSPASNPVATAAPLAVAGGGQPHENRQPYQALSFIIALEGVYPPRD